MPGFSSHPWWSFWGRLKCTFWLKRRASHPLIRRVELIPPGDYIHHFRLQAAGDLDAGLQALLRESYAVGCQEGAPRK